MASIFLDLKMLKPDGGCYNIRDHHKLIFNLEISFAHNSFPRYPKVLHCRAHKKKSHFVAMDTSFLEICVVDEFRKDTLSCNNPLPCKMRHNHCYKWWPVTSNTGI